MRNFHTCSPSGRAAILPGCRRVRPAKNSQKNRIAVAFSNQLRYIPVKQAMHNSYLNLAICCQGRGFVCAFGKACRT